MTGNATGFSRPASLMATLALLAAGPLAAQDEAKVVRDRDPDVEAIATTPIRDLNLTRDPIPVLLQRAAAAPYDAEGLNDCAAIGRAIAELDAVLGADLDVETAQGDDISVGKVAQGAVASLIPFRGIIREITGAADHQREFEQAIYAGSVRRGFLKGLGQQRGCAYPARPAFARVRVTKDDRVEAALVPPTPGEERGADGTLYVSQPVIQPTGG